MVQKMILQWNKMILGLKGLSKTTYVRGCYLICICLIFSAASNAYRHFILTTAP